MILILLTEYLPVFYVILTFWLNIYRYFKDLTFFQNIHPYCADFDFLVEYIPLLLLICMDGTMQLRTHPIYFLSNDGEEKEH